MALRNTNSANGRTNTISGKVLLKETNIGIPDLLVVIYDIDQGQRPEEDIVTTPTITIAVPPVTAIPFPGDRIGSVLTAQDGSWSITYEDQEFRISNPAEKRPDIHLSVLGPEDADTPGSPVVLFDNNIIRQNSGRIESYLIRITKQQLKDAKIQIPEVITENTTTAGKIEQFRTAKRNELALKKGMRSVNQEFEEAIEPENKELRNTVKNLILPDRQILHAMDNFVRDDISIAEVQTTVFDKGTQQIDQMINTFDPNQPEPGKGIKMNLVLKESDKQNLESFNFDNKKYFVVPEPLIQQLLFKKETDGGVNAVLFSNNPVSKSCIQKTTEEKCASIHTGITPEEDHHNGATPTTPLDPVSSNGTGIIDSDISHYLKNILAPKDSTRFHDNGHSTTQRPNDKTVQEKVNSFLLEKGPADTTAFYDFHSLQIAFQHVWQQLLDETLVNLTEKINTDLENTGRKGVLSTVKQRMDGLRSPGRQIMVAFADEASMFISGRVPTEINAAFDITYLEYDALATEDKDKLLSLAKDINQYETDATVVTNNSPFSSWFGGFNINVTTPDFATMALLKREQGERIIDNVRINKANTTNQLLRELHERLLSKYEFTVFAADRNYHSINFGIMNTFRQQWEPICYQAGKLVKTVPLAPKEERKYSVKTTFNTKVTRKEAIKNNSMLHQEANTTSRAESEIVAKAQDKSNFNMSVKLDYSKISSQVTFGKDAQKESSQAKKEFREAVIKAAQEFKEERALEIDTEEVASSEYSESGMISNPNDELSVTYLFYELQRRYRVSEQLYRVMPVVLVAQEVPSPDQITEAWIVAHDWILNRSLLDDSFRPALQYLAQKNVGDDFAIRELRKNLRQQRTLVSQLQLEFSKLKQNAENKYAAMEKAVDDRISEEHEKRFYRWRWWFYREQKPDTPPDPEMAKALEQAATDEHKYAVEKAEKMALGLQREVNALHQLTQDYNNVMRNHLDRITQCKRLITHIKENILYYMQAIWSMEPPDQRFMRLFKVKVPSFEASRTLVIEDKQIPSGEFDEEDIFSPFRAQGEIRHNAWLHGKINRDANGNLLVTEKDLVEVADLDTVLGFKGNYMIFPMKEHNALTEMMAAPFIDQAFGAMDPDQLSNINLAEYSRYICCLHNEDPEEYERLKPVLRKYLENLLSDPLRNGDEVIVPTGSLFIEMLPSDKTLLEDFKLKHREWDVYKVQADVRKTELENIRYAARILNEERGDPDVEKKILVEGLNAGPHIDVDDN
jgi:hypothetical protein